MNNFPKPHQTSLTKLSEHDWNVLSNTWARGIDFMVYKVGRKWAVHRGLGDFPMFKTKREAGEVVDNLILAEARHRAWVRNQEEAA